MVDIFTPYDCKDKKDGCLPPIKKDDCCNVVINCNKEEKKPPVCPEKPRDCCNVYITVNCNDDDKKPKDRCPL